MKLIGLTGGIGAGKSLCAEVFRAIGIPIYNSDTRAKKLMTDSKQLVNQISKLFGNEVYLDDGLINRKLLASIIFTDREKLKQMNQLVHPAVRADFLKWGSEQKGHDYIIQESALLFETGSYKVFDHIILVDAPVETRVKRVMQRDQVSKKAVLARMKNQLPSDQKRELADFIVDNDGDNSIIKMVLEIHYDLIAKAGHNHKKRKRSPT